MTPCHNTVIHCVAQCNTNAEIIDINVLRKENKKQTHTMKNYDRVRSNGGHLYILRLNFDFNDHKGFVGS